MRMASVVQHRGGDPRYSRSGKFFSKADERQAFNGFEKGVSSEEE